MQYRLLVVLGAQKLVFYLWWYHGVRALDANGAITIGPQVYRAQREGGEGVGPNALRVAAEGAPREHVDLYIRAFQARITPDKGACANGRVCQRALLE